ncbi:MAG: hypothetical protein ACTHWW_07680 [Arthrobacter sp.]|uniref:hypothetical protein n=1 Tax=unclassified Arthrobacter TaxID=235627 RepID=UPI002651407F|nr:hypothetical protein [Micrococcaceae bacterium]MDN5813634.1 hypothetical protein [Micrococcaceae bacterium]MDN5823512.1 hypothetical protein [Micrococcaceae bacterium]MDN5879164.1 hypothetical protein [Micrococcaceae bacterium]MDN5886640.1 hypothetical protein [Micrococcaceae bacterium]
MLTQVLGTVMASGAEAEVAGNEGIWPFLIGGGIFAIFLLMLFVVVSFTNVGNRHEGHAEIPDSHKQFSNKHGHDDL